MKNRSNLTIFTTILSVLACIGLLPQMQAAPDVVPAPDGCYPGFTTAEGCNALRHLTTGAGNTGVGWYSLFANTTGSYNTGFGAGTLVLNTAVDNTAVGAAALLLNTSGTGGTAVGTDALVHNDSGNFNDAVGAFALDSNTDGFGNNAFGNSALFFNVIGAENTALGDVALAFNDSTGSGLANNNTAVGGGALFRNVDGSENTAVGTGAGPNVVAGTNNTYVGDFVGTLAPDESGTIRIGDISNGNGAGSLACFIGGIFNNFQPVGGSVVEVTLNLNTDELGWDIGPSQRGSAPAAPRSAPGRRNKPQSGARPAVPQRQAFNDKVEKLQAVVQLQQKQIVALTAQLKEQAAQIQKVSAQVEVSKPAPQVVTNKP